jgi:hypothetical protein
MLLLVDSVLRWQSTVNSLPINYAGIVRKGADEIRMLLKRSGIEFVNWLVIGVKAARVRGGRISIRVALWRRSTRQA